MIGRYLYRWLPMFVMMTLIYALSSMSSESVAEQVGPITSPLVVAQRNTTLFSGLSDLPWLKIGHIVGYALLGVSAWRGFYLSKHDTIWLPVLICFLYACSDEYHQNFVPGRSGSLNDVALDTLAALAAIELALLFRVWTKKWDLWGRLQADDEDVSP